MDPSVCTLMDSDVRSRIFTAQVCDFDHVGNRQCGGFFMAMAGECDETLDRGFLIYCMFEVMQ